MGKIIDAFMGRHSAPTVSPVNAPATIGRPVPVADIHEPPSALTSGSSLNRASSGWAPLLDAGYKIGYAFKRNHLMNPRHAIISGNYGMVTSRANFGFRYQAFDGMAGLPTGNVRGHRSEWNTLTAIVWGQRVSNPNGNVNTTKAGTPNLSTTPAVMVKAGVASIASRAVKLS
jgi:hypothetical protein